MPESREARVLSVYGVPQENHDEDPELVVSVTEESPEAQAVRQAILGEGKQVRQI